MYFDYGYDYHSYKSNSYYVRAVRGGQSQSAYVNNGNGTVTDTSTGLMWQQAGSSNTMTWEKALSYCERPESWRLYGLAAAYHQGITQSGGLQSYNPAINTTYFPNTISEFYWSSTTYADGTAHRVGRVLQLGNDYSYYQGALPRLCPRRSRGTALDH